MEPRVKDYYAVEPTALKGMLALEKAVAQSGLEGSLLELVKTRVSQINGCAFCLDMHWKDARNAGESEQRLYGLSAWHEAPYYTARERAALAWAESLTKVAQAHPTDAEFGELREHFTEKEAVQVTYAIMAINAWNRLAIGMGAVAGSYTPASKPSKAL